MLQETEHFYRGRQQEGAKIVHCAELFLSLMRAFVSALIGSSKSKK